MTDEDHISLTVDEVQNLAFSALCRAGCDQENADAIAEKHLVAVRSRIAQTIAKAERDGCRSHGLFRLPGYISDLV